MRIPMDKSIDAVTPPNRPKVIHAGDLWQGEAYPYLAVTDEGINIQGDLDNGIGITGEFGTSVRGPVSFQTQPAELRISAYWALNPMLLASIGSMAAMPVPVLVPTTPPILSGMTDMSK